MTGDEVTGDSVLRFDDVVVDAENFAVTKGGDPVALTPRAFDLLIFLIRKRERVVEKQELFDAIWKDTFVTDNALTRAVKEIRQVLGDSASSPRYIETVHKRGYRFVGEVEVGQLNVTVEPNKDVDDYMLAKDTSLHGAENGHSTSRVGGSQIVKLGAVGVLLLTAALYSLWGLQGTNRIETIAVLPFQNESDSVEVDYLADGITETLIGTLTRISDVTVKSRSSVFRYKGNTVDPRAVGKELGVNAVLMGRIVRRGDELTLYLNLVDTSNETNIWSKQYRRGLGDLVALQNEIARDVARSLGNTLSNSDEQRIAERFTENSEAYRLYLEGRYHFLSTRSNGAETAIAFYKRAIALDPSYARAYAGLAEAAIGRAFRSEMPSGEVFPEAKVNAGRAVELDADLPEGYTALALINIWYERDWAAARANLDRSLELAPASSEAHLLNGLLLYVTGSEGEGLASLRRAVEAEPMNMRNWIVEAQFLNFAGRTDAALSIANRSLEADPNFYLGRLMAATALVERRAYREAIEAADAARALNPIDSLPMALKVHALAKSGDRRGAEAMLADLVTAAEHRFVTPYSMALAYNGLGKADIALDWVAKAVEQRDIRTIFLRDDPKWADVRANPRFQEMLMRSGLSVHGQ